MLSHLSMQRIFRQRYLSMASRRYMMFQMPNNILKDKQSIKQLQNKQYIQRGQQYQCFKGRFGNCFLLNNIQQHKRKKRLIIRHSLYHIMCKLQETSKQYILSYFNRYQLYISHKMMKKLNNIHLHSHCKFYQININYIFNLSCLVNQSINYSSNLVSNNNQLHTCKMFKITQLLGRLLIPKHMMYKQLMKSRQNTFAIMYLLQQDKASRMLPQINNILQSTSGKLCLNCMLCIFYFMYQPRYKACICQQTLLRYNILKRKLCRLKVKSMTYIFDSKYPHLDKKCKNLI